MKVKNAAFKHARICLMALLIIGCATVPYTQRKSLNVFSESQENSQGAQAFQEILKKERETSNTALKNKIEEIGRRIAAVSGRTDFQWEFKTLESKTPNAFCLPGGKVAIYTGIIPYALNEAGLATIMGHEIGHALARHGGQRMTQQMGAMVALHVVGATAFKDSPHKDSILGLMGAGATVGLILPFSRDNEREADEIGLILMAQAGYDPREAPLFWERFSKAGGGSEPPKFLSTHPPSSERKSNLESQLSRALPLYEKAALKTGVGVNL